MAFEKLKLAYDRMVSESNAHVLCRSNVCSVEMKDNRNIDVVLLITQIYRPKGPESLH